MAPIAASITVTFTSEYIGCHRVCYRLNNSGGYSCTNVDCAGGGASCSVTIPITVDNETCTTVEFDGYVQACCQDVSSLVDRIPFSTSFVPSPSCKRYLATCNNVPLASISVTNGGSGYTIGSHPSVSFSGGGGGSGATATANVGTGFILTTNITFIGGGSGYVDGTYAGVNILGGSGSGAVGTFTVSGGQVVSGLITTPGSGYQNTDVLHPDASMMGGNISNATFSVNTDYGKVISVTLNTVGSGYTVAPAVTIAPPPSGTTATATANLGYCTGFTVDSCVGQGNPILENTLQPGQSVDFCTAGSAPAPSGYAISLDTGSCLCNCTSTTIQATGSSGLVFYSATLCDGAIHQGTLNPLGSPNSATVCIVSGSLLTKATGGAGVVVTTHGAC